MGKKKTHEQYQQDLLNKGIVYKPIEDYKGSAFNILHECPKGHQWYVAPSNILKGRGCPQCVSTKRRKTNEEYQKELVSKGISYTPIEPYLGALTKILHICSEGHKWGVTPGNILSGQGCPFCASNAKVSSEEYNQKLINMNIQYRPIENYVNSRTKIIHECTKGHQWYAKPNSIINGKGCPICVSYSFDPTKPCKLYFISFSHNDLTYYKVGITTRTVKQRYSKEWNLFRMALIWELNTETGYKAKKLEQQIINENSKFLTNTGLLGSGNTETFSVFIKPPII